MKVVNLLTSTWLTIDVTIMNKNYMNFFYSNTFFIAIKTGNEEIFHDIFEIEK